MLQSQRYFAAMTYSPVCAKINLLPYFLTIWFSRVFGLFVVGIRVVKSVPKVGMRIHFIEKIRHLPKSTLIQLSSTRTTV